MSNWAEEDDTDFFSDTSFQAYKKIHDQDMIKILQSLSTTSTNTNSVQLSPPTETIQPSYESTPTESRFTKVTKKKQWKHHTPLNK